MTLGILLLFPASILAGAINAIAGGGALITFPILIVFLSPVTAVATNCVAMLPGVIAGAWGFREEFDEVRETAWSLGTASVAGGIVGALLLTWLPGALFRQLVPWLSLGAAVLFSARPLLRKRRGPRDTLHTPQWLWPMQFLISVYGGYFGAAVSILTLAALSGTGMRNIHQMNAAKTFTSICTGGIAAVIFMMQGDLHWKYVAIMASGAILGGYLGARLARRVNHNLVNGLIAVVSYSLAAFFFLQ